MTVDNVELMVEKREPLFRTEKCYRDVIVTDTGIDTKSFLEASRNLTKVFDLWGRSPIFYFAENDLKGDIDVVEGRYLQNPAAADTLETMMMNIVDDEDESSRQGLIRLLRTLSFSCTAFRIAFDEPNMEPYYFFKLAYEVTLREHHSFVMRGVVALALNALPTREWFFETMAEGAPIEELYVVMSKHFESLAGFLQRMKIFIESNNYGEV